MPNGQNAFELFDHTADVGVRVFGPSLPALLMPAAAGLYAVIGGLTPDGDAETRTVAYEADESAILLRDFLAELLLIFDENKRMLVDVTAQRFDDTALVAEITTRPIDLNASDPATEVKAITYHELRIDRTADGYTATYIVDI